MFTIKASSKLLVNSDKTSIFTLSTREESLWLLQCGAREGTPPSVALPCPRHTGCCWWQWQQQGPHLGTVPLRRADSQDVSYQDSLPVWTSTYFASAWSALCSSLGGKPTLKESPLDVSPCSFFLSLVLAWAMSLRSTTRFILFVYFKYMKLLSVSFLLLFSSMPLNPCFLHKIIVSVRARDK